MEEKGPCIEALTKAETLLAENPNAIRALIAYGYLLTDIEKDYHKADSLLNVAETLCGNNDKYSLYFVNIAQAHSLFNQYEYDKVIAILNKVISNYPRSSIAYGNLGAVYARRYNLKLSLEYSKKAQKLSDDYYIKHNIAIVYILQGKYKKSIPILEKILSAIPDYTYALSSLGYQYP